MTKKLHISQILVYYDLPEVFIASDQVGTNYICLLIEAAEKNINYISTAISTKKLSDFINGTVDLRNIFESPETNEWYIFNNINDIINAELWGETNLPADFLPENGFIYKKPLENNEQILSEVIERKNAIVHLAISDEEDNYSIDANDLGDVVKLYQAIIENGYKKALAQKNITDKKSYYVPQNYKLRAFASSRSSFNVHFYSTAKSDLFGNSIIEIGLEKFDEITAEFTNKEEFIKSLRTVKGHTISSLRKLISKLIENDIKLKHKWFAPNQEKIHYTIIDKLKAEKIFEILNLSEELGEETKIFNGYFVQVDVEKGTWRIYNTEDEKEYNGESSGELLQGVTVETVKYELTCQEIIEELTVMEKEKARYILQKIEQT